VTDERKFSWQAAPARQGRTPMALYKTLHRIRLALLDCVRRTAVQQAH
jgi:hypothetical protein